MTRGLFSSPCLLVDRIAPAMLRQASYGTIKIGTYQSLKRLFVERPEGEWRIHFPLGVSRWVFDLFIQVVLKRIFLCDFTMAKEKS